MARSGLIPDSSASEKLEGLFIRKFVKLMNLTVELGGEITLFIKIEVKNVSFIHRDS
jgi:hypothetical protein